ncbi:MAG: hypothetical protein AAFO79_11810 [Pseudomonadota bacterium]
MFRFIGRMLLVCFAFLLACIAAAFVIATLGMERFVTDVQFDQLRDLEDTTGVVRLMAQLEQLAVAGTLLFSVSLLPAVLVVIVGEVARLRSLLYYVTASGAALAALPLLAGFATSGIGLTEGGLPQLTLVQVLATGGFAGGVVYWLIAGRSA